MSESVEIIPLHTILPECAIVRAARGDFEFDWPQVRAEYCTRLSYILTSWDTDPASYLQQIEAFRAPPHTVQRLSELLDDPLRWYSSSAKYSRALDRVLNVTFTIRDYSVEKEEFESMHHDSPLIPIPWLTRESMTGNDVSDEGKNDGEKDEDVTVAAHENGSLAETVGDHAKIATGSAPMDAADVGPQSEDVKEAIASSSTNGVLTNHSLEDNMDESF